MLQNFVGLSVSDGYITCGSETNEVSSFSFVHSSSVTQVLQISVI